jgi:hypothetical protein
MSIHDSVRKYKIYFIVNIRGEIYKLKAFEERAWRQESESVAMRNLFAD